MFKISLSKLLTIFYAIIFILVIFSPKLFLGIAFDSVRRQPSMTVPFILALALAGVHRGGRQSEEDSFGLLGISAGPMLAVLSMGIISGIKSLAGGIPPAPDGGRGILYPFLESIPRIAVEVFLALIPIIVMFFIFQAILIKLGRAPLVKIIKGLVYTFTGFVLFLTGVNAGFMEAGTAVGYAVASFGQNWIVIVTGFCLGLRWCLPSPRCTY